MSFEIRDMSSFGFCSRAAALQSSRQSRRFSVAMVCLLVEKQVLTTESRAQHTHISKQLSHAKYQCKYISKTDERISCCRNKELATSP